MIVPDCDTRETDVLFNMPHLIMNTMDDLVKNILRERFRILVVM